MRILFLDDRDERVRWGMEKYGDSCHIVRTADDAIESLSQNQFDLISLDHDLSYESFVDSNRRDCGMEVVRWIVANKPIIPKIIVHSSNHEATEKMLDMLSSHGYMAIYEQAGA